jgi:hypothetical protein
MKKEIVVTKKTDTNINPHWDTQITLTKEMGVQSMMEQTNLVTIVEVPKELNSISFMGVTAKSEHIGFGVLALFAVIIAFRFLARRMT